MTNDSKVDSTIADSSKTDCSVVDLPEKANASEQNGGFNRKQSGALVYCAFVAGLCSIVYELLIATTVSYFLGDSVTYFSVTIGLYMAAMGAGSYCSKFINKDLISRFVKVEIALALVGGLSIPLLYLSYTLETVFIPTYVTLTLLIGFFVGLEIPFLTRLMESFQNLKANIANILSFDYVGALIATLAFPFFLLPTLGNYLSSLVLGLINLSIVFVLFRYFKQDIGAAITPLKKLLVLAFVILTTAIVFAKQALEHWDQSLFNGRIIHSEQTRYQKIVLTRQNEDIRMYLNGNIQFSSVDEHRYHEALVMYPMAYAARPIKRVLLLGAGDGLAIKQLLKFQHIEEIILVDLDERVVELAKSNPYLTDLNMDALNDARVTTIQSDAFSYLRQNQLKQKTVRFDLIISDLPDPNTISLARLYSKQFYRVLNQNLHHDGLFVTQATSPFYSTKAFWSIVNTVAAAEFDYVLPYHADVPSFGDWGFVLAAKHSKAVLSEPAQLANSQYLNQKLLSAMQVFASDQMYAQAKVNRLDKPALLDYYLEGWRTYGY